MGLLGLFFHFNLMKHLVIFGIAYSVSVKSAHWETSFYESLSDRQCSRKFGSNGTPFKVSSHLEIPMSSTDGKLYLGVNDNLIYYDDNDGFYDVTIKVE
jgi:hypothetical protein